MNKLTVRFISNLELLVAGLNKYSDKERREIRRRVKKERDLRYPKRKVNNLPDMDDLFDEPA